MQCGDDLSAILPSINGVVDFFENKWVSGGALTDFRDRRHVSEEVRNAIDGRMGLYRFMIAGKIAYVGKTVEVWNRSYWKRMSEYLNYHNTKKYKEGRSHESAIDYVNANKNRIEVEFLVLGDEKTHVCDVEIIEAIHIFVLDPPLNKAFSSDRSNILLQMENLLRNEVK